ncbi:MAG: polysaccharide biosynthesis/export family protein [Lachnospiraceae bacterium]|nr:polysaccharide biosynthesis/export family protein [Lachnospiraceae bacterium]
MLNTKIYIFILSAIMCISCSTKKDLAYFKDLQVTESGKLPSSDYQIKIEPEDELTIWVSSIVPEASAQFNSVAPVAKQSDNTEMTSTVRALNYIVNKNGSIDFPGIGEIKVQGMTTMQLKNYLVEQIGKTVKDPQVSVILQNFKINVLGEVKEPQMIKVQSEKFSVFDALASCGDLTEYGKRDGIMVIRQMPDGETVYQRLNLHDSSITGSPFFYLKQNDVVYVEPNNVKQDNSKYNQNNGFKLSVISTIVSAVSVVSSLIIALSIK